MEVTSASTTGLSPQSASRAGGDVHVPPGVRKIRYGCEHIETLLKKSETAIVSQYSKVVQAIDNPSSIGLHIPKTKTISLKPTFLCLQCNAVCDLQSRDQHDSSHKFCAESGSGSLYCRDCRDYIHDPTLENVRLLGGKKRKHSSFLSDIDSRIVANNTTPVPCRALALRGLYNMGQTCFMSVVLQSLIHNPFIRAYYLSEGHRASDCDRDACTSCALDDVFVEFHSTEKAEGYGMVAVLQASWKGGGSLAGYSQQDAHEYLQFTLNSLHAANGDRGSPSSPHGTGTGTGTATCTCIIHNTFGGMLQSTVTCTKCKNVTTAFDPFMDLSLDVRDKSGAKKKSQAARDAKEAAATPGKPTAPPPQPPPPPSSSAMDLYECLDRFTSQENLPASEYTCRKCASAQSAVKRLSISRLPPVLPIHLKRFSHSNTSKVARSVKLDTRVKFPLSLDMRPYCRLNDPSAGGARKKKKASSSSSASSAAAIVSARDDDDTKTEYELSSVVVHHGRMDSGHYINYARVNDEWFMFDDSKVVLVDESTVLSSEAYMLFYVVGRVAV